MSFGWSVGNFIAISGLAVRVYIAYKDAPDDYRYISKDIAALQALIDRVAQHFRDTTIISSDDHQYGQRVLESCQTVLEDLDSFIEKYKRLAAINKRLVLGRVKLGNQHITALQSRLISETVLLNGFVRRSVRLSLQLSIL